jgi:PAS domain S-box-containing protein
MAQESEKLGNPDRADCPTGRRRDPYRDLIERSFSAIVFTDLAGVILECNDGFARLLGIPRKDAEGMGILDIAVATSIPDFSLALRRLGDGSIVNFAFKAAITKRGGQRASVEVRSARFDVEGGISRTVFVMNDITDREIAEQAMAFALSEKTALLQEIRHRVGNNLQIIASLMRLTKSCYPDGVNFAEAVLARVEAMALLYQNMVEDKGIVSIHLGDFIEELVDETLDLYGLEEGEFAIETEFEVESAMDGDRIIPIGLFIGEVARIFVEEGGVGVLLRLHLGRGDGALELEISSRNCRLPAVYDDPGSEESLLLHVFAEQLKGELEMDNGEGSGTRILLRVPD